MDDLEKIIDDCVKYSIVDPKVKAKFQDILGVKSPDEYIAKLASKYNLSIDACKDAIAHSPDKFHVKMLFILA